MTLQSSNELSSERRVRAEKLLLLFHQSFPGVFISTINSVLLVIILWAVQNHTLLIAWVSILALSALARFILFARYKMVAPVGENLLAWEMPYFVTFMISCVIWGLGSIIIMPVDSQAHQIAVFFFMIGMSGGAISLYSTHRVLTLAGIGSMLLPVTIWFLIQGDLLSVCLAIAAMIFLISAVRTTKMLSSTLHQNLMMNYDLQNSKENAEKLARVDQLTGLDNRRAFYEQAEALANYSQRKDDKLGVIIIDIDHFKQINDTYGHAAGDLALEHVGRILAQTTRQSDVCARIGGEEFGLLLLASTSEGVLAVAEKQRQKISATPIIYNDSMFHITASFGVACGKMEINELLKRADAAMYRAKNAGRDKVIFDE